MQTVTIDILNDHVVKLLRDLELMDLIRLRNETSHAYSSNSRMVQYKGAMTKQPQVDIDKQLNELRSEWE